MVNKEKQAAAFPWIGINTVRIVCNCCAVSDDTDQCFLSKRITGYSSILLGSYLPFFDNRCPLAQMKSISHSLDVIGKQRQ